MAAYNRNFELHVADIERIEAALRHHKRAYSLERLQLLESGDAADPERLEHINRELTDLQNLLGRLHNQKIFYRPGRTEKEPYVSG